MCVSLAFTLQVDAQSRWTDKSPHKTGFITVNGVKLHYLDWGGEGEAMLFLHGLGDTPHIYDELAPKFTNQFRVLGLTRRGHGQSDKPETGYDTATLVEDIRQFLDALNIPRAVLVGHSIAGDELTRLAGAHPDRLIKLVYLDAAYDRAGLPEIMKQRPPELSPTKTDMESLDGFRQWVSRLSFWSDAWEANLREIMVFSADGKILKEAKPDKASRLLIQGTVDSHPDYTKIKSPALNIAVIGFSSRLSDFVQKLPVATRAKAQGALSKTKEFQEQQTERFRKELPSARVVVFTNADHHCFIEREDDVVREMRAFLADSEWSDKSPHKSQFVTVNGVKLHYLDWGGKGDTLLFLHGQADTAHRYDDFAPRFTNQFRVLGLTRRGHGESEMPETGYDTATLVEDIRQFLDALKIQRVVLAGHSFAGDELTRFAVLHPDRVIKLVYFDSAFDHSRVPESLRFKPLHGGGPEWLPTKEESESPEGRRRWVNRYFGEKRARAMYSMMENTYSERHEYAKIKAPALAFFAIGYKKDFDVAETLPEPQRQQVLEFLKTQRKYHEQEIEHFRREIPNGRVIVFTNAPHMFPFDRKEEVLREMREFLGKSDVADEPEPVLTDAAIQQMLEERINHKKAIGLVVGRLQGTNRSIVAAGNMAVGSSRPVDGDTLFELGSITKVFTGILLGDMANRGEVRPDDPATKYLPSTAKMPSRNGHVITLAHLASHRSGLPGMPENLAPADKKNPFADYSLEQGFEFLSSYKLPRDPGSAYEYSNLGLGLLGDFLARRAGTNYEQLVLDRICRPFGMNDTRIKLSPEMQGRFASGHDDELNPVKHLEFLGFAGAGALRSTANDFLKFLAVVLHPRDDRLSKAILRSQAARTNTVRPGGAGPGGEVAWCWYFNTLSDEIIFHSGMTAGFHGYIGVNRKRDRAVVVFSNCSRSIDDIGLHLLEPRNEMIPYGKAIVLDQTTLERYVGTYAVTPTIEVTVSREKNEMYIQPTHQSKAEIFALARDEFFSEGPARFSFRTNAAGIVTELIVRQAGKELRASRKNVPDDVVSEADKSPRKTEFVTTAADSETVLTDSALRQILEERIKDKKAVGIVVGRLQGTNRSIVAAGTMALNSSRPVDGDTVFEIGSITKVFTGTLLADMVNRGEVQPNDSVSKYLPSGVKMPSRNGKVITLAHLASHRSGLPREPAGEYGREKALEFLSGYELTRDPGSAYQYSNLGAGLLADLLGRRAGTSYEQLILDRICKPLRMNDTRISPSAEMQNRMATGYDYELKPAKFRDTNIFVSAGAFRSTANDFLKLLAAALNPRDDTVSKAIVTSQAGRTITGLPGMEVAWGWHFKTVSDEIIWHSGKTFGFHSFMGMNRKRNRAVVIFSNCTHSIDTLGFRLLDPLGEPDESTLERYVGTYELTPTDALTVSREKDELYLGATGQAKAPIFASGRDQFYGEAGFSLSFRTNASGMVTDLIFRTEGKEHRLVRK